MFLFFHPGFLNRLFLLFALLAFSGCSDSRLGDFDLFLARQKRSEPANPIFQKQYTTPSVPRSTLESLLNMSLYQGEAQKYGDVIMQERSVQRGMGPVVFSHQTHRIRFTCQVCHLELEFSFQKGESGITREDYLEGRFCGSCHNGEIAFSVRYSCNLCHISKDSPDDYSGKRRAAAGANLPGQEYGDGVNWVQAVQTGAIAPQNSLSGENIPQSIPLPNHLELPLRWTTREPRTLVRFPHKEHLLWLDCANCHPDIFSIEQMGTETFDKEKNLYGMFCGTCHMTVAFPMNGCNRCHPNQKNML